MGWGRVESSVGLPWEAGAGYGLARRGARPRPCCCWAAATTAAPFLSFLFPQPKKQGEKHSGLEEEFENNKNILKLLEYCTI